MTDAEINRELRRKWCKSVTPRYRRKSKLKMRYGKDPNKLAHEIRRTNERLQLLCELMDEQSVSGG